MSAELSLDVIPHVLDADEVPFVVGFGSDARPSLAAGGAEYRRGVDRVSISWKFDLLSLQALLLNAEGATYLTASAGPFFSEWWPLLEREGANPARPLISAGVAHMEQTFTADDLSVNISITPPEPGSGLVFAVWGIERAPGITDSCLLVATTMSLAVIKAALLLLGEYRTLVDPVPDLDVRSGNGSVPLAKVIDVARQAAAGINWVPSTP